ncbi:MAG: glycosyltransferase [Planctomycetes bacterium]|nr:glycosyltransferase [Planctomycetota bacterium]
MPESTAEKATIVIVTFNSAATIDRCLDSVARHTPEPREIVVVDNASKDDTAARVRKRGVELIINDTNRGFTAACNQGIAATRGARPDEGFVILLNPDSAVTDGWLQKLIKPLRGDVGATGPVSNYVAALQKYELYIPKSTPPRNAGIDDLAKLLADAHGDATVPTKLLIGFCLAMRRDLIEKHGALDEDLFLGNDDLEYSLRLRRLGYKLLVVPGCFVYHEGQKSFQSLAVSDRERLVQESTDALYRKLRAAYGDAQVPSPMELWGIDWFEPTPDEPLVSIVIPVWNNLQFTNTCLRSIAGYTGIPHEVIVVDNGSTDGTPEFLKSQRRVRTITNDKNLGFAAACNQGMRAARGKHILLLNNDVVVTPRWLELLLSHAAADPAFGVLGPRTNFAAGPQQLSSVSYKNLGELESFAAAFREAHAGERAIVPRIIGLCMFIKRECYDRVGLLDERFGIGNFEDDDYCVRARLAGFQCVIAGDVFVHHFGSQTFKLLGVDFKQLMLENRGKFVEKWKDLIAQGEPAAANK